MALLDMTVITNPGGNSMEPLWTTRQLAEFLNVTKETIDIWRYRGDGPPYLKLSRSVRYQPSAVYAWLEDCQRDHPSQRAKTAKEPQKVS
jgi:predicted DNA-binding transcriptional regulator AlpA